MANILFVQDGLYEKFGVMSVSSYLKSKGHNCDVLCAKEEKGDFVDKIIRMNPDIIGFSLSIGEEQFAFKLFEDIKKAKNIPIIVGGAYVLVFPEIVDNINIDFVLLGDGEYAIEKILDIIDRDKKDNVAIQYKDIAEIDGIRCKLFPKNVKIGYVPKLEDLPMIDWSFYSKRYPKINESYTRNFFISMGCVYDCSYCYAYHISKFYVSKGGKHFRMRNMNNCLAELKYIKENTQTKWIRFQDSSFTINRPYLKEFLIRYKQMNLLPFICYSRIETIDDEVIRLLKEAGCEKIVFGIQSGNERVRMQIAKRNMTNSQIKNVVKLVQSNGIRVGFDVIFGFPSETMEEAFDTIKLCRELQPAEINSNVLIPYPMTYIYDYSLQNNYIDEISLEDISKLSQNKSFIDQKNIKRLINLDKLAYYFIHYPYLSFFFKWLLYLPPNRFFSMLKSYPFLKRSLKYDNIRGGKFKYSLEYLKQSLK